MSSPSPIQLLAPNVVQRIVSHVVGSSRQVFAGVLANSNEHNKVLRPLMWVSQNFRAIAYPLYCYHFKLELAGPEYHERSMYNPLIEPHDPGYHMRNDLGYPTHHLAKELTIELEEWAVYDGHALRKLTLAPFERCAFPLVRSITFHFMMYKPLEFDTHNPPESGAAIGALVERIKQMAPMLDEIRVATKVYGRPPDEASEEFSSFVSQFYQIASRVQYGCATEFSLSVELQLKGICDLVHINYKVDDNGQQFAQLARLNASTLQSLVARCDLDIGVADLIRKTPRTFMKYPCLHTLKLIEYGTSKTQRRITFKGAVPFPKLRCLYVKLAWPVNDDTFFRGNAATLEYLNMNMDRPVVHALSSLKVFTPGSHPKLKCVKVRLASDTPNVDRNVEAQFMQFILSIGPEAPVRGIDGDDYFDKLTLNLAQLGECRNIQYLSLANTKLDLWRVIDLIRSLPLLSDLRTLPPSLGQIPSGVSMAGLPAYVHAKYSPMGGRFRCWHFESHIAVLNGDAVNCTLLLALACPNFDYAASFKTACKYFMWSLEGRIASDEFKPYETRLRRLLFDGWIEGIDHW
ncbi:hypothetical protein IWW57_002107 [Coemansia sp. S610]|nr:hypothetical protein IWW57_002107 [Coemansia sp. S610]